jgi:hypothetical protein
MAKQLQTYLVRKYGLRVEVRQPKLTNSDTFTWKITIEKHADRPDLPSQKMHMLYPHLTASFNPLSIITGSN